MAEYQRPNGFRYVFDGVDLRDTPDAMGQTKFATAVNVRSSGAGPSITTRPGYEPLFSCNNNNAITDIRAYSTLGSDNLPRYLVRDTTNKIYLDTGSNKCALSGNNGFGVSMIPFRPGASPQTWMYVAGLEDYRKISAPDGNNNTTAYKVGIAEPQNVCDAAPVAPLYTEFSGNAANWANAGTAGSISDGNRAADAVVAAVADPVVATRYSLQVGNNTAYAVGQTITVGATEGIIQDVFPAIGNTAIESIYYYSGNTGNCIITPYALPIGQGPSAGGQVGFLRRGALLKLGGNEVVLVRGVGTGPTGKVAIEASTANTWAANNAIVGVPTVVFSGANTGNISGKYMGSNLTGNGVGTLSRNLSSSPFATGMSSGNKLPREDDYVHFSVYVNDPTKIIEIKLIFNINSGTPDYQTNAYFYAVRPSDLVRVPTSNQTMISALEQDATTTTYEQAVSEMAQSGQESALFNVPLPDEPGNESVAYYPPAEQGIGSNQYTEVTFPVSAMTRIGTDQSRSLADTNGVRVSVWASNNCTVRIGSLWVGGGSEPDVGTDGADYQYRVRPRSSVTGAKGNPSPPMRSGIRPRRQSVTVSLPSAAYDSQIDTWDVFRYGGSVTSWRYIGSAGSADSTFTDEYFDDAARAGNEIETDNFEPWPSIGLPQTWTDGGGTTITLAGTVIVVSGPTSWPAQIDRWLPGTLLTIPGKGSYTLRKRPVQVSSSVYRFEIEECAGSDAAVAKLTVPEPVIARQPAPYMWGPNEQGDVFAVGDALRPGTLYFSKSFNPDSAPDAYNLELTPPSEPLIGGEVLRGVSLVSSTKRWWALYPSFGQAQRYTPVEQPIGRGMISPYGKASDGQRIFFWCKDGIAFTDGSGFTSLTDQDLYPIFPHEGVVGQDIIRNGITYHAPDYSRLAEFRLAYANFYLYADYPDLAGVMRTLVCDLHNMAWCADEYADAMTVHYGVEQQEGSISGASPTWYPLVVMGDSAGHVYVQTDRHNDDDAPITCTVATFEWDGGDPRAKPQWGDLYLDCLAPAGMNATPITLGANAANATAISANNSRQFKTISLNGSSTQKFMGLLTTWSDNFVSQANRTELYQWQPSYLPRPEETADRALDWFDFGRPVYLRGVTMMADTYSSNKAVAIRSADDWSAHNLTINHNGQQTKDYAVTIPFITHMVRLEPQDTVAWRHFGEKWIYDPWPPLISMATGWLKVRPDSGAAFLQGAIIPLESNGAAPALTLLYDGGGSVALTATVTPTAAYKTPVPYSLATPIVVHQVQLQPTQPCRIWTDEIQWVYQPTPELATTWKTQPTAHGMTGYQHVQKIECAYASNSSVLLTVTAHNGTSPSTVSLPATGGVYRKALIYLSPNKGTLYEYSATSSSPFQAYLNDWVVWVGPWGRPGDYQPYRLLGGEFGDMARI